MFNIASGCSTTIAMKIFMGYNGSIVLSLELKLNSRLNHVIVTTKILRMNFVIDLLSYEENSCRYAIPPNIQQRLISIAKKD
jgi:hypothetical protein